VLGGRSQKEIDPGLYLVETSKAAENKKSASVFARTCTEGDRKQFVPQNPNNPSQQQKNL
jgi:hypothetical protein